MDSAPGRAEPTPTDRAPRDAGGDRGELQLHGSLVEVRGLGVLLLGPSGVGKSECVIELVRRGHRLVADDIVRLRVRREERVPETPPPGGPQPAQGAAPAGGPSRRLEGWSPEHIRHYIEVRGLGLMSVSDLFGAAATRDRCDVDFIVRLETLEPGKSFERIGLERPRERLLEVDVPAVRLPVHAASNLATLVELAVRDWQLRLKGVNAAQRLDERLRRQGAGTLRMDAGDPPPRPGPDAPGEGSS